MSTEVVWRPIPGSSQELAIDTRAHQTLYHGARGPGKTITQLMRFRRRVGLGYGSFWRGIILDKEFKNLADVVAQGNRFFPQFEDGCKWLSSASEYKWTWPTGEELLLRHAKKLSDYDNFHGHEYPFIGWNELTKHATLELYDKFLSTNRSSFTPELHTPKDKATGKYLTIDGKPLPRIPLEVFSTANPNGAGHNAVKRRFINPAPNGHLVKKDIEIFNPQTQRDEIFTTTQVAIFGSYRENPFLDPKYVAELNSITDPNLKAAWLYGNWDVISGGAFDDVFDMNVHRVPRFKVPDNWRVDRSFDWGSSHPFAVCWFAEANGEEVIMPDGSTFCPKPGSLIQLAEWYGATEIGANKGLKLSSGKIAEGIIAREISLMENGWIQTQPWPGPADNEISNVKDSEVDNVEVVMSKKGVRWTKSDKSNGARINGFQLFRDRLEASKLREGPGWYTMANNEATLDTIPNLPRDEDKPDDVDSDAEDHLYDAHRYRILAGSNRYATKLSITFPR